MGDHVTEEIHHLLYYNQTIACSVNSCVLMIYREQRGSSSIQNDTTEMLAR